MAIKIVNPTEGCTKTHLGKPLVTKFENLGFKQICVHDTIPIAHNSVFIFSSLHGAQEFKPKSVKIEGFKKVEIDLADSNLWSRCGITSASLDLAKQHEDLTGIVDTLSIPIIYTERDGPPDKIGKHSVGWFDPSNNILFLCDITHNTKRPSVTRERVAWLLDRLADYRRLHRRESLEAQEAIEEAVTSFTMGADIEFEVLEGSTFIGADRFYPSINEEIGRDGHRETGELRPAPSRDPLGLAKNVKELLKKIHDYLPKGYKICGGGGIKVPIGLHLHFGNVKSTPELTGKLNKLLAAPVLKHQGELRANSSYGNQTSGTRNQPHGWEYRPLFSTLLEPIMLESVFCVAHGIVKAHVLGLAMEGSHDLSIYKQLPNWDKHQKQIRYFVDRFVTGPISPIDGEDIRANWFGYMPKDYGIRRFKFMDDDRMEWLYQELEGMHFSNLHNNWILLAMLGTHVTPEIVTLGIPRNVVLGVAKKTKELQFAISTEKVTTHEFGVVVNVPLAKRCVIDKSYKEFIVKICGTLLQGAIDEYATLKEEGKNPVKCQAFTKIWQSDPLHRNYYNGTAYEMVLAAETKVPNLEDLCDKDLAVLKVLYNDDPELHKKVTAEISRRGKEEKIKILGQYG